jgi:hydroxyethylthiazole kinase-like uncharacterized protein yjeF
MQSIEKKFLKNKKMSTERLMESAGELCSKKIAHIYGPVLKKEKIAIICGPGNNGADGLVIARYFARRKIKQKIFIYGNKNKFSTLFKLQLNRLKDLCLNIQFLSLKPLASKELCEFSLIIDALYGVSFNTSRKPDSSLKKLIFEINSTRGRVVSIDLPSGLDATTGLISGVSIKATNTLTLGIRKLGLYIGHGPELSGGVSLIKLGFSKKLLSQSLKYEGFEKEDISKFLPPIKSESHKGSHGHLLVVAGSSGFWGAANLCTEAAYRMGAGYVSLAVLSEVREKRELASKIKNEVLLVDRDDLSILENKTAVVIGPGASIMGLDKIIKNLYDRKFERVVLDADAITAVAKNKKLKLLPEWLLTPHEGELARLLGVSSKVVASDRLGALNKAIKKYKCHILLKGFHSLLADPRGQTKVILSGNAGLAKAGSGDVLTGMIGGLLAQKASSAEAAVFIHGYLADQWVSSKREMRSLMPSDIIARLPKALFKLAQK